MSLIQSKYAKGILGAPYPAFAGAVVAQRFAHVLALAPLANDIIELAPLFGNTKPIDLILDADDLDSGTAIIIDVGIMSGKWGENDGARTCGAEFFSGSTLLQAGGVARPILKTAFRIAPVGYDRSIGVKITTAAGTFVSGQIGLTVLSATG
ncbi:MAG: hypothetical protein DI528_12830 [Shinella sp.]|nr:MAG: hypothetical protein DI528_12830 [Shinella sp.]